MILHSHTLNGLTSTQVGSDDVLIMRPTTYFLIPIKKNYSTLSEHANKSSVRKKTGEVKVKVKSGNKPQSHRRQHWHFLNDAHHFCVLLL